jgi:hypothetical protein
MEREKGFESQALPVFTRPYDTSDGDAPSSTRPPDASGSVETEAQGGDDRSCLRQLPVPTAELFITAGVVIAGRAARERASKSTVEEILRRAVDQSAALRGEAVQ